MRPLRPDGLGPDLDHRQASDGKAEPAQPRGARARVLARAKQRDPGTRSPLRVISPLRRSHRAAIWAPPAATGPSAKPALADRARRFTPSRRTVGLCRPPTGPACWTKPSKRLTSSRREPRPGARFQRRHQWIARARGARRGGLPRRSRLASRRLCRRRHLFRHLGLSHFAHHSQPNARRDASRSRCSTPGAPSASCLRFS